jgi:glycine/D-amino acid oxidase-like deaminating enzyme
LRYPEIRGISAMKIVIVGAGINGVTAALELTRRGHEIALIDPGPLPHPLAASTDISKAVRAAYGADEDYTELAERSIPIWRKWNVEFGNEFYHEVGFLFMRQRKMRPGDFEYESFSLLEHRGHKVERIDSAKLRARFPAWNAERFCDGFLDLEAGYAESGRVVAALLERAKSLGVKLVEGARFEALKEHGGVVNGVLLGMTQVAADVVVTTLGAWTPYLLPFTAKFFRATGQSVFHLRPKEPEFFSAKRFPVFGADITSTGYYGFPLNRDGVVKVANHGPGREMSPDSPECFVTAAEEASLREFLAWSFPGLADAEIVYTRVCFYCDTHDGDFWIARDPERRGLIIAAGDCGHGFKFAPVLGEIIADVVEEKDNPLAHKFRWRPEVTAGVTKEAARKSVSS